VTVLKDRWEERVLPHLVEATCGSRQVRPLREQVCGGLAGRVLEIGFGSGLNVPHYPGAVQVVHAVEPNDVAWRIARRRVAASPVQVVRSGLDGRHLAEDDGSFDHVLTTFTLCTVPDLRQVLSEVHRVLRPGGRVHFLEHGLAPDLGVRRWQQRLEPLQRRVAGGCHLTRRPVAAVGEAGFDDLDVTARYLPGPAVLRPMGYLYLGSGRRVS
jgi:SAM-dependent methyltransferase